MPAFPRLAAPAAAGNILGTLLSVGAAGGASALSGVDLGLSIPLIATVGAGAEGLKLWASRLGPGGPGPGIRSGSQLLANDDLVVLCDLALEATFETAARLGRDNDGGFLRQEADALERLAAGSEGFHAAVLAQPDGGDAARPGEVDDAFLSGALVLSHTWSAPDAGGHGLTREQWGALLEALAVRSAAVITGSLKERLIPFLVREMPRQIVTSLKRDARGNTRLKGRAWDAARLLQSHLIQCQLEALSDTVGRLDAAIAAPAEDGTPMADRLEATERKLVERLDEVAQSVGLDVEATRLQVLDDLASAIERIDVRFDALSEEVRSADRGTELLQQIERSRVVLSGVGEEVSDLHEEAQRDRARRAGRQLYDPRLGPKANHETVSDHFFYGRALDRLRGRDDDVTFFRNDFLLEPSRTSAAHAERFRWMVLWGVAGSGKSRLAMELLERCPGWPIRGFAKPDVVDAEHARRWHVDQPTFIVVDYASLKPGVPGFVQELADRAERNDLTAPVRVLLVDRRDDDPTLQKILQGAQRKKAESAKGGSRRLEPLADDALVAIIRGRLEGAETAGKRMVNAWSPEALLALLGEHDRRRRPLYAAFVGHAIAHDYLPRGGSGSGPQTRRTIFDALLDREQEEVWHLRGALKRRYENLLILATFAGGLRRERYEALLRDQDDDALALDLPTPGSIDWDVYRRIAMTSQPVMSGRLAPLEPDLLGERLVLRALLADEADERSWSAGERSRRLRCLAWKLGQEDTAGFVQRCVDDFPQDVQRLDWLLPSDDAVELDLLAPFVHNMLWSIGLACEERPPDPETVEQILGLLDRLETKLAREREEGGGDLGSLGQRAAEEVAASYALAAGTLGRVLNPTIGSLQSPGVSPYLPEPRKPLRTAFNLPAHREGPE